MFLLDRLAKRLWDFIPTSYKYGNAGRFNNLYVYFIDWCKYHCHMVYADYLYIKSFGYGIDWKNPRDLNEIINVLAFTTDTTVWSCLADKFRVRDFVKERGCEEILIPLYGNWDSFDDVDFSQLPSSFVLKCNNGFGDLKIVKEKNLIDKESLKVHFENSLQNKFGYESAEPHYLRIKPCLIAEKLLEGDENGLIDYKVWCFNGKPYFVFTVSNRDYTTHSGDFNVYSLEWDDMDYVKTLNYKNNVHVPKPQNLDKMLHYAEILSEGFPQVRVDFYNIRGKIYFGEMTFTSACGRMDNYTREFLIEIGKQIKLR